MNLLKKYLIKTGETQISLADRANCHQSTISRIINDKIIASIPLSRTLERVTGREVTMVDLRCPNPSQSQTDSAETPAPCTRPQEKNH